MTFKKFPNLVTLVVDQLVVLSSLDNVEEHFFSL